MRISILILTLMSIGSAYALTLDQAGEFLQGLRSNPDSAEKFVHPDDLEIARRLGITYPESQAKALISWGLTEEEKWRLSQTTVGRQIRIDPLEDGYFRLILFPGDSVASRTWIFRDGKQTSSILYKVKDWVLRESKYFRFYLSDPSRFHDQNVTELEAFLVKTAELLGVPDFRMEQLENEKIIYCFCQNQEEIRELTGFSARGMYILSHDLIVSTYSSHTHELAHLLIKYRLGTPHLFTHPMLLEGFAVARGGRGGRAPRIQHQLDVYLHRAGWLKPEDLLEAESFAQLNASISYPGSALYNEFLIESLGIEKYLKLYLETGGDAERVSQLRIPAEDLPAESHWLAFLNSQPTIGAVAPMLGAIPPTSGQVLFEIDPDANRYGFALPEIAVLVDGSEVNGYTSFLFEELVPEGSYTGGRYLFRCSHAEVGLYDLFTNTMIGHYAAAFAENPIEVPEKDGLYSFTIEADMFDPDTDPRRFELARE